jgi:acyl-[acyl-carrier-protein]-phospholipid O-acyltransferase / long-chain-fatty-acid--[acyl-carrier-protein] ligase
VAHELGYAEIMRGTLSKRLLRALLGVSLGGKMQALSSPGPLLIVANHPHELDPVLVASALPLDAIVIVSRRSALHPLCRLLLREPNSLVADLSEALSVRRMARLMARGHNIVVFPENRPVRTGAIGKVYEAPAIVAARTGATVVPINIRYGAPGYGGTLKHGPVLTVGTPGRIELPAGLPARERRRQATIQLLALMQRAAVEARPRRTLFSAFVDAVAQQGRRTRIVEDIRQIEESYATVLKMTLALSRLLGRCTVEREIVGVMLPNTVAAVAALLGLSAAGRVPAMLNYSAGPDSMRSSVAAAGIRTIVTSRRFVEAARLERLLRALGDSSVIYLEDLRAQLGIADKLWLAAWALWRPRSIERSADPGALAIVLFTSGSEGRPKGVGLSHDGVLANMAQLAAAIDFTRTDKFLNALPMYHTYGLIACTLMPLMYGTRLFLYTNPLHYRIIPEIVYSRRCTYLFGTSTFLGHYARQARALDFSTLRYVISGGEKLNPEVQRVYQDNFGLRVFEGYGATECGPAISLGTPQRHRAGTVGAFLAGVEFRLVPVAGIAQGGVLHVRSPNMMLGYLLQDRPGELQPTASELGAGWHSMGDVVDVDEHGFVTVLGRLKRFAKVAGEMVALELVERIARECSPQHQHAATVGMTGDRGETTVLFTTDPALDRMRLHKTSRLLGAQDLAVAREIVIVQTLPVLGTGKTDYVVLSDMARLARPPVAERDMGRAVAGGEQ